VNVVRRTQILGQQFGDQTERNIQGKPIFSLSFKKKWRPKNDGMSPVKGYGGQN
jgi:hypothetical protein